MFAHSVHMAQEMEPRMKFVLAWSSDVCSSDLVSVRLRVHVTPYPKTLHPQIQVRASVRLRVRVRVLVSVRIRVRAPPHPKTADPQIRVRVSIRLRVRVSIRVRVHVPSPQNSAPPISSSR